MELNKPSRETDSANRRCLERLVIQHMDGKYHKHLALDSLRYEALRKLNPRQYAELHKRNMKGENFDAMVDALVLDNTRI